MESDWVSYTTSRALWTLFFLSFTFLHTSTRSSSTHWRLVVEEGSGRNLIVPSDEAELHGSPLKTAHAPIPPKSIKSKNGTSSSGPGPGPPSWVAREDEELVLQILTTTVLSSRGSWTKNGLETSCSGCSLGVGKGERGSNDSTSLPGPDDTAEVLDCGKSANFTYYDQLMGIANRVNHPHIPEPQVALLFRKKNSKKDTIDLNTLERKLRKAKKEVSCTFIRKELYNTVLCTYLSCYI